MKALPCLLLILSLTSGWVRAQEPAAFPAGETSLNLELNNGIRPIADSRVTVPLGESVRIHAPRTSGSVVVWTKDGVAIAGANEPVLTLNQVSATDAGAYTVSISDPPRAGLPVQTLRLSVGGAPQRFVNSSTRAFVGPGEQLLITGFVVGGSGMKKVIIRAIGPTLSLFNVANPLQQPSLLILDSQGKRYDEAYVYPAVIGGPNYEDDLRESLARAGAFALPPNTKDAVEMRPFRAGSYTVHVSGVGGTSGAVLLELYEVPE